MGLERTDWAREASLLRPAKLTVALFAGAPALDQSRPWVPEQLLPLHGGSGVERLNASQRLRYNHAYARQLVGEFIWTERRLIVEPLKRLAALPGLARDKATVLQSFISDELHHIRSFSVLEELAIAADQPATRALFQPSRTVRLMVALAARFPVRLSFWAPVIEAFEQYALKIGQSFHRDETVDPLFREVFLTHARDEARHCRLDVLIGQWLQAEAGPAGDKLNRRLLPLFERAYRSVEWGLDSALRELVRGHPETAADFSALLAEAKALRRSTPLPAGSE